MPQPTDPERSSDVIEPEIIDPGGPGRSPASPPPSGQGHIYEQDGSSFQGNAHSHGANAQGQQGHRVFYQVFTSAPNSERHFRVGSPLGGGPFAPGSSLPSVITLLLTLGMGFQHGFLAALGFLFFSLLGSAFALFFVLRRFLEGRAINPWVARIVNWVLCYFLVTWLAGGLS